VGGNRSSSSIQGWSGGERGSGSTLDPEEVDENTESRGSTFS